MTRLIPDVQIRRFFLAGYSVEVIATMYALDREQVEAVLRGGR